jgi:hypothetical protein
VHWKRRWWVRGRGGGFVGILEKRTLAEFEGPEPELLLTLTGLHEHVTLARVSAQVAPTDRLHVLRCDRGAVELAAAAGKTVGTQLASRVEVAVDVAAGLELQVARHIGGSHQTRYRGRGHRRCCSGALFSLGSVSKDAGS